MISQQEILRLNSLVEIGIYLSFLGAEPKNIRPLNNHTQYRTNCWFRGGDNPNSLGVMYAFEEKKWRVTDYVRKSVVNEDLIGFAMKVGGYSFRKAVDLLIFACGKDMDSSVAIDNLNNEGLMQRQTRPEPIDKSILESFQFGLHPYWYQRGYTPKIAEIYKLGFSNYGELKDRTIIPIYDEANRLVSIQGRSIDDRMEPKYTYLSGTGGSAKLTLYNFNRARARAMERNWIGITEGASSVWRAHQHGFDNFMATLSVSVTDRQVEMLVKENKNIVILFDFDATETMAGQVAAIDVANKLKTKGCKGVYIANIGFHAGLDDLNQEQMVMTLKNAIKY